MSPVFSAQANSVRVGAPPVLEVNHIEKYTVLVAL